MADRTQPASAPSPERSAELRRLGILDSPPDDALNAIVKAAAGLFGVSSAVVTILDDNRHWFKARYGLEMSESPRGSTFSEIVIERNAPLLVADASSESRWANLTSAGPPLFIRFFVGVPLRSAAGVAFGALSAFDRQPRLAPAAELLPVLEELARAASAILEMHPRQALEQVRFDRLRLQDSALNASSSGIVIADARLPDTPLIYANPAFERMTGYRLDEVAGLNCRFLQGPDTDPAAVTRLHNAICSGEGTSLLIRNYRKNGEPFWNELTISPVRNQNGALTHFIGIQNDVSARIHTERELRRLSDFQRAILDATSFELVATAVNGVIVTMNEAARKLLRLPAGSPLPVDVTTLFDPDELAARAAELSSSLGQTVDAGAGALFTLARNDGSEEREWTWIASDGGRIPMLLSCSAIRDSSGEATGFLLSGIDLSVRMTMLAEVHRLAAVVENASDFVGISTVSGEVLYANRAGRRMLGLPETGPLPSSHLSRYVTRETIHLIRGTINALVQRGERWEGSCTIRHFETKEIVEMEGSCFPVPGRSSSEPMCLAAVLRNVTQEHRTLRALTQSERRFHDVVAAAGEFVWETDSELRLTYVSDRVAAVLGYEPSELIGRPALGLTHPDDAPGAVERLARDAAEGRPFRDRDSRSIHKDGSVIWLRVAGVPFLREDGSFAGCRGVCLDITAQRQAQLEMQAAKEAAEEAARVKSQFLSNMSHEVRTPLSGVIGMTGILIDSGLTAAQREHVETIRKSSEGLLGILNDILDITKIESGRMEIAAHSFDPVRCVADSVQLFQPGAAEQGIPLELEVGTEVPANVVGDSLHLRQILHNLIGNAVKFAGRGSIRVRLTAQPEPPDAWILRFDVIDTGIGIPADRIESLFKAFSQVDSSSMRRHGGTGLGLAIANRLAELMGGTMWVRSELGAGSTFSFTVRVGEEEAPGSAGPVQPAQFVFDPAIALRCPLRILVAEDNPVNQKVALFLLRKFGYKADVVSNGQEVLERLRSSIYDLILLDIQMPGMDGLQAAREIRTRLGHASRPWLVALTANALADDRREASEAGMNDYLSKPVQGPELQAAIERAAAALQASCDERREAAWELPEGLREALADDAAGDAKAVVVEILTIFLQDSEPLIGEILSAHAAADRQALERLLHRLKGSSAQVGALRLSSLCLRAELALRDAGIAAPSLGEYLGALGVEWKLASGAISRWLSPDATA